MIALFSVLYLCSFVFHCCPSPLLPSCPESHLDVYSFFDVGNGRSLCLKFFSSSRYVCCCIPPVICPLVILWVCVVSVFLCFLLHCPSSFTAVCTLALCLPASSFPAILFLLVILLAFDSPAHLGSVYFELAELNAHFQFAPASLYSSPQTSFYIAHKEQKHYFLISIFH